MRTIDIFSHFSSQEELIITNLRRSLTIKPQIQVSITSIASCIEQKPNASLTLSMGLLLIGILALSCLSTSIFKQQDQALTNSTSRP